MGSLALVGSAADWRPVDASELGLKAPRVDPAADAEAIFWDVHLEDRLQNGDFSLSMYHYLRIKIFTSAARTNTQASKFRDLENARSRILLRALSKRMAALSR